jgi:hypothetical protein
MRRTVQRLFVGRRCGKRVELVIQSDPYHLLVHVVPAAERRRPIDQKGSGTCCAAHWRLIGTELIVHIAQIDKEIFRASWSSGCRCRGQGVLPPQSQGRRPEPNRS